MDNQDLNVLRQLAQWLRAGHHAWLGTITRTWGSAPRPVGSMVGLRADGLIAGSVSGGCIEDDLIERLRAGTLAPRAPETQRYGVDAASAQRFGLPCGGSLALMLEPLGPQSRIPELLERLDRGERVQRELDLRNGAVRLSPGHADAALQLDEERLLTQHGPQWRLLVIGAGQLTQYLAQMAQALGYQITVCDPRSEYQLDLPGVALRRDMPDDCVQSFAIDAHCAVVALTHDPKLDDLALMEALRSPAFYVGAIGSRSNQARRRARLAEHFGLSDTQLDRLHGPVGLAIGARTPPEIALSILAHMTAERYGVRLHHEAPPGATQAGCSS